MTASARPLSLSASSLVGNDVKNHQDETLGEVKDLMIDLGGGFVRYAVVAYGELLGMGGKYFAVPWSALSVDTDEECFRLDETTERLKNARGFDKDNWPQFADPRFGEELHTYFRQPTATTSGPNVLSSSSLIGDGVINPDGEDLGKIEDLMIDLDHGRISYAVLSFGSFFGVGGKHFALPWGALQLSTEREKFFLGVTKETLEESGGFDKDNWPDFADRTWSNTVYSRYGVAPYWS